jgi:signal transduction histidine kinase
MLQESNERLASILMAKTQRVSDNAALLIREHNRVIRTAEQWALFFVVCTAALLVIGLSSIFFLLNRTISASLEELKRGTEIIAAGNLEHHINVTGRDEIGDLAIAFNKMTHDLGDSYQQLQNEVQTRKKTERELRGYTAELKRSNAELEQFAYVASHDLQEPLRMVASFTQLLASRYEGRLDPDADEFIHYAVDGANRMQRLINDLLAYSRVGTGALSVELTDCNTALAEARINLKLAIEDAHALLTQDELPTVMANSRQLTQLFQNLIGNALKFHRESLPSVHISAKKNVGEWIFSVRDNGIGIDPHYKERIFGIFQRLHGRDEYPGTGIGLAICKKIVERHGGRIWVESEPGKGSVFYFAIPERGLET